MMMGVSLPALLARMHFVRWPANREAEQVSEEAMGPTRGLQPFLVWIPCQTPFGALLFDEKLNASRRLPLVAVARVHLHGILVQPLEISLELLYGIVFIVLRNPLNGLEADGDVQGILHTIGQVRQLGWGRRPGVGSDPRDLSDTPLFSIGCGLCGEGGCERYFGGQGHLGHRRLSEEGAVGLPESAAQGGQEVGCEEDTVCAQGVKFSISAAYANLLSDDPHPSHMIRL
jgi:hypothetical protein